FSALTFGFSRYLREFLFEYRVPLLLLTGLLLTGLLLAQIIGWRLWLRRVNRPAARRLVHLIFLAFNLGWAHLLVSLYSGAPIDAALSWVGRPIVAWQTVHLLAIVPATALAWILLGLAGLPGRLRRKKPAAGPNFGPGRRNFLKTAGTAGLLGLTGLAGYGVFRQGRPPRLTRQVVPLPGLPDRLDGFVIAHITDLHLGLWANQRELRQATLLAAAARPHLVVLTGDLVDRNPEFARLYYEPLLDLAGTPGGVWGVLGNHDHYTGPERIAELLDGRGLTMLVNRRVNLPGLPLSLTGLDDQGTHQSWLGSDPRADRDVLDFRLVSGPPARPGDLAILLNHRPEGFAQAAGAGYKLYLAGHTHGGQYQVPGHSQANLAAAFYKYTSGLYHEHGAWLNVSRGLASVGMPFRLWAWPEINILTLKKSD
ncbi:MAG: metallophosphoesterase, partial [Candidatus Adiutrix sp.]|nr:metallophosphoesterase [Candidatus Adiutrix sp.]